MSEILNISWNVISVKKVSWEDYVSLTDMARSKNEEEPKDVIRNWMRNRNTLEFLGLWEQMYNKKFKGTEFDSFKKEAWLNSFTMSPQKWIDWTNAIWIVSKSWRYDSWTFAHKDIAMEFASWISPEFKLFVIKEFQRLKEIEQKRLDPEWNVGRIISKINYKLHTDSIKANLIDWKILDKKQKWYKYANEADMLNVAVFWKTNKQWRIDSWVKFKDKNIRDYASIPELTVLSNCEYLNSKLIEQWLSVNDRFNILQKESQKQLQNLIKNTSIKKLNSNNTWEQLNLWNWN